MLCRCEIPTRVQLFTAPAVRPAIKYFWRKRNRITIGTVTAIDEDIMSSVSGVARYRDEFDRAM